LTRALIEALQALLLLVAALTAWITWLRLRGWDAGARFWLAAAAGTTYLAIDERLDIHESLGRSLREAGFREPPGVNHVDDVVLLAMALAALVFVWRSWREVHRYQTVFVPFVAAILLYGLAVQWDATASTKGSASWWFEESLELVGGVALLVAYAVRLRIASDNSPRLRLDLRR
jgi:hypothetical protein